MKHIGCMLPVTLTRLSLTDLKNAAYSSVLLKLRGFRNSGIVHGPMTKALPT
jgi:hypothetical protein